MKIFAGDESFQQNPRYLLATNLGAGVVFLESSRNPLSSCSAGSTKPTKTARSARASLLPPLGSARHSLGLLAVRSAVLSRFRLPSHIKNFLMLKP